jgi:hypothetical protein
MSPSQSPPPKPLSEMTQEELLQECERRLAIARQKEIEAMEANRAVDEVFKLIRKPLPLFPAE